VSRRTRRPRSLRTSIDPRLHRYLAVRTRVHGASTDMEALPGDVMLRLGCLLGASRVGAGRSCLAMTQVCTMWRRLLLEADAPFGESDSQLLARLPGLVEALQALPSMRRRLPTIQNEFNFTFQLAYCRRTGPRSLRIDAQHTLSVSIGPFGRKRTDKGITYGIDERKIWSPPLFGGSDSSAPPAWLRRVSPQEGHELSLQVSVTRGSQTLLLFEECLAEYTEHGGRGDRALCFCPTTLPWHEPESRPPRDSGRYGGIRKSDLSQLWLCPEVDDTAVVSLLFRHENGKWLSQAEITYYLDKCLPW